MPCKTLRNILYTVCQRSLVHFYIGAVRIRIVKTSWTYLIKAVGKSHVWDMYAYPYPADNSEIVCRIRLFLGSPN